MSDLAFQADLAVRLIVAAAFGAAVGFERELHGHPAGMRTHLLVSLGSALFTVLSAYGFDPAQSGPIDPTRIAAQIVSGIGFLGAGAILKDGLSIRGLTTAASLWATAAIGLAAGAGQPLLGLAGTAIVLFSLWPLNRIAEGMYGIRRQVTRIEVELLDLDLLAAVTEVLTHRGLQIVGVRTQQEGDRFRVQIDVGVRPSSEIDAALAGVKSLPGVELVESGRLE